MALDGKWRVTTSRYVHEDRWLTVRADDCLTDDEVSIAPFYVLEYPDWVHIVALDAQDNVLLVRQYRHGLGDFSLELPAGAIDPADADPLSAAARELLEETGCAGVMTFAGLTTPNPSTHANLIHTIVARDVSRVAAPVDDPTERLELLWVSIDEAIQLALGGQMVAAIQVASLLTGLVHAGVATIASRQEG
jgi:8-oxo-dGDP phosphatase